LDIINWEVGFIETAFGCQMDSPLTRTPMTQGSYCPFDNSCRMLWPARFINWERYPCAGQCFLHSNQTQPIQYSRKGGEGRQRPTEIFLRNVMMSSPLISLAHSSESEYCPFPSVSESTSVAKRPSNIQECVAEGILSRSFMDPNSFNSRVQQVLYSTWDVIKIIEIQFPEIYSNLSARLVGQLL